MKVVLMIGDLRLEAEDTGVAGDVYILDASVATTNHFSKITPTVVKKFLVCVQVCNRYFFYFISVIILLIFRKHIQLNLKKFM